MFYTKLIFKSGSGGSNPTNRPTHAPSASPGLKVNQLGKRVQKNIDTKKAAAEGLRKMKSDYFEKCKNNNPESKEAIPDDTKGVAINFVTNSKRAAAVHFLMYLIEKYWKPNGKTIAWRLFLASKKMKNTPGDINFTPFERFMSKGNSGKKISIYCDKKGKWRAVDTNGDDEFIKSKYLLDGYKKIEEEFIDAKNKDSGILAEMEQDILKFWKKATKEGGKLVHERQSNRGKGIVKSYFKKKAQDKWVWLDQKTTSAMNVIYGAGVGRYLYKYVPGEKPKKDRLYMILIKGEKAHKKLGPAGYIEIDKGELGKWNAYDSVNKLKPNLIDKMDPDAIAAELGRQRLQAGETLSKSEKLKQTKGKIAEKFPKLANKVIPYYELPTYCDELRKKLRGFVQKKTKKGVEAIVEARIKDIETKIKDKIQGNQFLRKAKETDPKKKFRIRIDSNDEVTVTFKDPLDQGRFEKMINDAKEKGTSVADLAKDITNQLHEKMKKMFGKGASIAMWVAKKFLKLDDGIKKILSGGDAPIAAMALGALGITVTPALVGAKRMDKVKLDKFLADSFKDEKTKEAKMKKLTLTQNYRLTGYSIVIPKGKGVILKPGAKLKTKTGMLEGVKPDKKVKLPWGKSKSNVLGKDQEIIIENGTQIPKGTIFKAIKFQKA